MKGIQSPTEETDASLGEASESLQTSPRPVAKVSERGGSSVEGGHEHNHVKRSWQGNLEPSLSELADAFSKGELEDGFTMPLFDGDSVHIQVNRLDSAGANGGVLRGRVNERAGSLAVFSFVDDAESGTIQMPDRGEVYRIRAARDGGILLEEIDARELGECAVCSELAHQY